ncbi:hypothetical protein PVAG01_08370 [Phlyctema vagabunda]|uniref:Uncharacterized protein n=1 Tax=Phlyctema vagabunda TaxID=108571 RepID=A0ABR4P9X0_9HELO
MAVTLNRAAIFRIGAVFIVGSLALIFFAPWYKDSIFGTPLPVTAPSELLNNEPALPQDVQPIATDPQAVDIPSSTSHNHVDVHDAIGAGVGGTNDGTPTSAAAGSTQTTTSVLHMGEALESKILVSPNNKYRFGLKSSGQLSLLATDTGIELFSSNTKFHWPVDFHAELNQDGVLELTWTNDTMVPKSGKPWVSSLLPGCDGVNTTTSHSKAKSSEEESDGLESKKPILELLDSGLLQIRNNDDTVVCILNRAVNDPGRLAVIYAGFLRTYLKTCAEHQRKLVVPWSGSGGADVHVYSYLEEAFHEHEDKPTRESIEKNLRDCFGDSLKTVTLVNVKNVSETWDGAPEAVVHTCGQEKLNRHVSQFKSIWLAGREVQKYMTQKGIRYDYILKTRLDLLLHGNIPRLEELAPMVADGAVMAPRVAMDWNWYAMIHDGSLIAGVTDIMAFGRAAQMWTYMNLYVGMKDMKTMEWSGDDGASPAKWTEFNTHGHAKVDVPDKETCTPEGALAYWLSINNIPVKTEWRFQMALLRNSGPGPRLGKELGEIIFTCPIEGRDFLCPGFVPGA